jgi:transposase InsO family protein
LCSPDLRITTSFLVTRGTVVISSLPWKTRVELANAIFEFIEIFYDRHRRNSALGYHTPIEYEQLAENHSIPATG